MGVRYSLELLQVAAIGICAAGAAVSADLSPSDLVERMKSGGLVVYIRHAATEADYADQVTAKLGDCSTQRVLSESGWQDAKAIGRAFASLDIPVGEVLSSDYCRAWQTADLAFGQYQREAALNFEPAEEYTEAQFSAMRERVLPLLTTETGNRVIVGHDDPFEAATGIYPEPQGVAYILAPRSDGTVRVLGRIAPGEWPEG